MKNNEFNEYDKFYEFVKDEEVNDEKQFKPLPFWREIFLKKEDLPNYYIEKREYEYNNGKATKGLNWRKKIHPILHNIMSLNRKYIDNQNYTIIKDERTITEKPVIFALTHIGKFDFQVVSEAIRAHQIPFVGEPETMYRTLDGFFLGLNGVIYCDTDSKIDRVIAKKTAIEVLKKNKNILICPEGVWNVTPNLLTIPLFPGIIEIAQTTGCEIVPVAVEQYGKEFIVNIGKNFQVDSLGAELNEQYIQEKRLELRDIMASLKWEIIETRGSVKRSSFGPFEEENEKRINERINEWYDKKNKRTFYNKDTIKSKTYREKGVTLPGKAFEYIPKMKLNKNNAFCFRKDISLPNDIQEYMKNKLNEQLGIDNYFSEELEDEVNKTVR